MARRRERTDEADRAKELARLKEIRDEKAKLEREEKGLREDLVPFIEEVGSYLYVDEAGNKWMAYYSDSDMTLLDIDELEAAVEAGLVPESVLELVAPRQPDLEALKQALNAGRIPKPVAKKCISIEKSRKTVRYKKEGDDG